MFEYVALIQGSTIVELTDGINYDLVSYGPVVAPLNDNALGPLYAPVGEQVTFHALGCTAAEAYANARAVNTLLDQAWRWAQDETVSPVLLAVKAQGSALDILNVAVLGRPPGGAPNLALPASWNAHAHKYVIQGITIAFVRRGQFLNPTTETTAASGSSTNPTVQSVTFASAASLSCPLTLTYAFSAASVTATPVILTARSTSRLQIYEAESGTFLAPFTSVADAANNARGGSVLRFTPASTLPQSWSMPLAGFDSDCRKMAVWAAIRNNSTTTSFTIQIGAELTTAAPVVIDTSSQNPRIVFLGIVALREAFSSISITETASAASGTLDIDYLVIQAIDDETSGAVTIGVGGIAAGGVSLDPAPLTLPTPLIANAANALSYSGDASLWTRDTTVAAIALATTSASWRATATIGGALVTATITAARKLAYLIPE